MTPILLASTATLIAGAGVAAGRPGARFVRDRRVRARAMRSRARRILFPLTGHPLSRQGLDAALRLARADGATLVPVLLARVPMAVPLDGVLPPQCTQGLPCLETIERRAKALRVPVELRVQRGRTYRHALRQSIAGEQFDRIVIVAANDHGPGFGREDLAWLLDSAPREVTIIRPAAEDVGDDRRRRRAVAAGLTLAALGVVFGDIGTSPLYAIQAVFAIDGGVVRPTTSDVYGVISLIFWAITLIVSIKYVTLVLRADNDGEGGVMALAALVRRAAANVGASSVVLVALGVFGASLFYGDSVITPAISVLSAVEGLDVAAPPLAHLIVPIALAILVGLFAIQRFGTQAVGRLFGPVMVVWFTAIGAVGLVEVSRHPGVLRGLSPTYALAFMFGHPGVAFVAMGAVVLAITGAEALYADMGHFGRAPIRRAWFGLVFPALTLNYLGQAALVQRDPSAVRNPFFLLLPEWARIPMVLLATVATVIASQAVISGAFSVSRQATQLGFIPRLTVRHTSRHEVGQIYVPVINWILLLAVVGLVLGFGSAERLAAAYGIAVSGTFVITTLLFLKVARWRWAWPRWGVALAGLLLLPVETVFLTANLGKIDHGGWLPLAIALGVFALMTTWHRGREIVTANRTREEGPLREFVTRLHELDPPVTRVPGTAVFLNASIETTPLAMRELVEQAHVLHERAVIVWAQIENVPHVARGERVTIGKLGSGDDHVTHVTARFGFQDQPDIPDALRLARAKGLDCDIDRGTLTYFLSRISLTSSEAPAMARWRKKLFIALARNAASPVGYFGLPADRTVTVGSAIGV